MALPSSRFPENNGQPRGHAGPPSAMPWEPKPGVNKGPTPEEIEALKMERIAEGHRLHRRWETWQSIRRYLLVLLISALGSLMGSAITIYFFSLV